MPRPLPRVCCWYVALLTTRSRPGASTITGSTYMWSAPESSSSASVRIWPLTSGGLYELPSTESSEHPAAESSLRRLGEGRSCPRPLQRRRTSTLPACAKQESFLSSSHESLAVWNCARAFGVPGDWGYHNEIGQGVLELLSVPKPASSSDSTGESR